MHNIRTYLSPAKINLYLKVISKRRDGYHNINTILQMVSLYDSLTFKEIDAGVELISEEPALSQEKDNLVYRAALAFIKEFNVKKGVRVHLKKGYLWLQVWAVVAVMRLPLL